MDNKATLCQAYHNARFTYYSDPQIRAAHVMELCEGIMAGRKWEFLVKPTDRQAPDDKWIEGKEEFYYYIDQWPENCRLVPLAGESPSGKWVVRNALFR